MHGNLLKTLLIWVLGVTYMEGKYANDFVGVKLTDAGGLFTDTVGNFTDTGCLCPNMSLYKVTTESQIVDTNIIFQQCLKHPVYA